MIDAFCTPPRPVRQQRLAAATTAALLAIAGAVLTPLATLPLPVLSGYIPAFCASMLSINVMLALLLFSRSAVEAAPSTRILGAAYWFVAVMFVPFILTFPGAMFPGQVFGDTNTVVWIWSFWHGGFGLAILRYAFAIRQTDPPARPATAGRSALQTLAIALVLTYIASQWHDSLPPLLSADERTLFRGSGQMVPLTILAIDAAALLSLVRYRNKSPEQLWLCIGMVAACVDVWLTFHGMERYSLGWYASKMASVLTSLVILISLFFDQYELYRRVARANALLQTMAKQDSLTGLANRRRFDEFLHREWSRCLRSGTPLSLLIADIDYFKAFNDRYGHPAGDACLRDVGRTLGELVFRPADLAARYGGEEFAIILGETNGDGALATGARIRDGIASLHIAHADSPFGQVTMSIGCATARPAAGGSCAELIAAADQALYQAKRNGRNRLLGPHQTPTPATQALAPLAPSMRD